MKDRRAALLWFTGRMALFAIAASLILPVAFASGQTPPYSPGNDKGFFVVENAYQQFEALKHHGEALGWVLPEHLGAPDPSVKDHYQGLARYPGDGVPVFYVTQLDDDDPILPGASDKGGYLHVVIFSSRPTTGERLRSNLLVKGADTEDTYPPFTLEDYDSWYKSIRFDGSLVVDSATLITSYSIDPDTGELIWETSTVRDYSLPAYNHPGSMAIVDDILFVPLDTRRLDTSPIGFIVLFDLRENGGSRKNPVPIHAIQLTHGIDNLAVTKYDFGDAGGTKYLVWVNGDGGSVTKFYKTTSSNLRENTLGLEKVQDWYSNSLDDYLGWGHDWPGGTCAHQSSTFLREPDGSLYMIGMRHGHPCYEARLGPDYADLFKIDPKPSPSEGFKITVIRWERGLACAYQGGGGAQHMRICNFAAASNAYVSPSGELILYSIPHNDEDWADPDFVRLAEFRHRDVNFSGTCTRGTGWAELYDDKDFYDRSIVFDWPDRDKDDFDNFNLLDGFNDKTSSVRWCAPVGCNIILYENDNYGGVPVTLQGFGVVAEVPDLGGFGDNVSSIRFDPNSICENSLPIADAGPNQSVSAGPDCTATINLDGSESFDPDEDPLTYTWTWNGNTATGVSPTIALPLGTTTITLIVNDGKANSEPDTVDIAVEDDTPPEIIISSPQHGETYLIIQGSIPIEYTAVDNCDDELNIEMTLDGEEFIGGEIDLFDIPSDTHTLVVKATDSSGNVGEVSSTFTVRPQGLENFTIRHMKIYWAPDKDNRGGRLRHHRPKKDDKFKIFGRLQLPEGYTMEDLEKSATVTITIAGESGNDTAVFKERTLRRGGVMWKYLANQQANGEGLKITKMTMRWAPEGGRSGSRWSGWAGFYIRGVLKLSEDLGMDTEPAEATVTVEMPVSMEAGFESLLGEENVTFKVSRSMNLWSYHGSHKLRHFPCDPSDTD